MVVGAVVVGAVVVVAVVVVAIVVVVVVVAIVVVVVVVPMITTKVADPTRLVFLFTSVQNDVTMCAPAAAFNGTVIEPVRTGAVKLPS